MANCSEPFKLFPVFVFYITLNTINSAIAFVKGKGGGGGGGLPTNTKRGGWSNSGIYAARKRNQHRMVSIRN